MLGLGLRLALCWPCVNVEGVLVDSGVVVHTVTCVTCLNASLVCFARIDGALFSHLRLVSERAFWKSSQHMFAGFSCKHGIESERP